MNNEQLEYVRKALEQGVQPEQLKITLRQNGHTEEQITQLFLSIQHPIPSPTSEQPSNTAPIKKRSNLVVISVAVIGILIVLILIGGVILSSSLNTARDTAEDAMVKSTLNNARAQAELFLMGNGETYAGLCKSQNIQRLFQSVKGNVDCVDTEDRYRISVALNEGGYYCVMMMGLGEDYASEAKVVTTSPSGFVCE